VIATGHETGRRRHAAALGAAGWLGLAAAPTFAVMALLTCVPSGDADMMCSAGHGASPLSGMVPMYVLMSVFHSAPWLKLISRFESRRARTLLRPPPQKIPPRMSHFAGATRHVSANPERR
jgi:hypothetical protein